MSDPGTFAAVAIALYAGHHAGDYWVQTDADAREKGLPGRAGRMACTRHVVTYVATQAATLLLLALVVDTHTVRWWGFLAGLAVSGLTHWTADRREHGLMFWLARRMPGKAAFLRLGVPRPEKVIATSIMHDGDRPVPLDNPSLGTGAWALDQAWHIFWGIFVAALVITL